MKKEKSSPSPAPQSPVSGRKKKRRTASRVLLTLLIVRVAIGAAVAIAIRSIPKAIIDSNIQHTSDMTESEVEVTPDLPPVWEVRNIALFGVDQEAGSVGRSDAMIIVSIDRTNNKIKMTSLSRDSLVPIEGHGEEKLTHAWAYGQARLAIKTINQNFGMNITDYAYVNFGELMGVVDYIGGVQLDVDAAEMSFLNENHVYTQGFYDQTIEPLSAPGVQQLNGAQALLYARDRTNGGDTTRTARQREVLMAMYQRVREQPLSKLPSTLARVLRLCHTNMNSDELLDIATWALTANPTITSLHMPTEDMECWNGIIDRERGWVRVYDLDQAKTVLHNFIYETDTEADATVSDTSTDTTTGDTTSDPE